MVDVVVEEEAYRAVSSGFWKVFYVYQMSSFRMLSLGSNIYASAGYVSEGTI